ncbi:MAG: 4Fe-4S binding protein [Elusimicrobia bacterium]|nr:4Fe-4S binding protein [Elusimicrobiota bacterium]
MAGKRRKIIKIDEEKCTGCGNCIPDCPEGALRLIDGKARLVSDLFCDGLGACLGACPVAAISVEEREAEAYSEKQVMKNIVKAGRNTIEAHLMHLKEHGQKEYLHDAMKYLKENNADFPLEEFVKRVHSSHAGGGCPGSLSMEWGEKKEKEAGKTREDMRVKSGSELRNWPVQLMLINPGAPYLKGADLLITADCVPFTYASYHGDFVKYRVVIIGCPKLDDIEFYIEKLTGLFETSNPKSVTVLYMEVPCCHGLVSGVRSAIRKSGKNIPFCAVKVGIKGEIVKQ